MLVERIDGRFLVRHRLRPRRVALTKREQQDTAVVRPTGHTQRTTKFYIYSLDVTKTGAGFS